jgi:hypothetical protein
VSIQQGISSKDFYFLNPEIDSNCTNLLLGLAYCVQAVGTIQTYSGYPTTSQFIKLTSATYSTANATQPYLFPIPTMLPDLPLASGTMTDCQMYRNQRETADTTSMNKTAPSDADYCRIIAPVYGVTVDQLVSWNPSLSSKDCAFSPGYRYCVLRQYDDAAKGKEISRGLVAPWLMRKQLI